MATEKDSVNKRERASRVTGLGPNAVDDDAYRKLVLDHVRPLVRDFDIRSYREPAGELRELVALHVEVQEDFDKPFIIDRIIDEDSERRVTHSVGWPTRSGADTHWEDAARIQQLISTGLRRPVTQVGPALEAGSEIEARKQLAYLPNRIAEWEEVPVFFIQLVPMPGASRVEDFYGQFVQKVRQWRGLRQSGFGLGLASGYVLPAEEWLALIDEVGPNVVIGRAGTITSGCTITQDFLGWNQVFTAQRSVINITAFIEFITEAIRFAYECVKPELAELKSWVVRCGAQRWKQDSLEVMLAHRQFPLRLIHPNSDSFVVTIDGTGDPFLDAATTIADVLGRGFGLSREQIPYLRDDRVDLNMIPDH